jgi:signal transduction histidine kinase
MIKSALHMQKLIDDLLSFSRTSSTEKVYETTDLNESLEEVKASLKHILDEKNVEIISSNLPVAKVIPFQFIQLLENIISNSIKYSKQDIQPKIEISSEVVKGEKSNISDVPLEKQYYKISIKDNGIGFEQHFSNKIFELFQRLHAKNEYSGTGIGLAICKKIMENHDGYITAESTPGEGSTFHIFLPVEINKID